MAKTMMTEAQMVGLVRNALLVAGYEMGQTGDHWPVIADTIHSIAKDWEEWKLEKEVDAEMKIHLYEQLGNMEKELPNCDATAQAELAPKLKELREVYDSYFSDIDETAEYINEFDIPAYAKRAEAIIATLGGSHE